MSIRFVKKSVRSTDAKILIARPNMSLKMVVEMVVE